MGAPTPADEEARLEELRAYELLDTPREAELDELVRFASRVCETSIGLISLVDESRQWFKARHGTELAETSRDAAFCAHAILSGEPIFEVRDARADPRFADNPLVAGEPYVRFYAGTPLVTPSGQPIGTLCVLDVVPRALTELQRDMLTALGRHVVTHLELVRRTRELDSRLAEERRIGEEVRRKTATLEAIMNTSVAGIFQLDPQGNIVYANPMGEQVLGLRRDAIVGRTYDAAEWRITAPDGGPYPDEAHPFRRVMLTKAPVFDVRHAIQWPDGRRRQLAINGAPVFDEHGEIASLVFAVTDITAQHKAEQERLRLEAQLRHAQKMEALGTLAGGIAHDFNNQLGVILGNAELALHSLPSDHAARGSVDAVVSATIAARGMV